MTTATGTGTDTDTSHARDGGARSVRDAALLVDRVDKWFPGVHALKDVTFAAAAGEVHGIVGENGAGKSTLMAVTAGVLTPDAGSVTINGTVLERPQPDTARDLGLAIVYQEPALVGDLTVAENILLTLSPAKRAGVSDPAAWVDRLLGEWRPPSVLTSSDYVRDLAPDARFVVEIVRALAEDPTVLVLDEPTEHLPAADVERLFACCRDLTARGGTVVYISHRIAEVKAIADRITVLCDGSIRATLEASSTTEAAIVGHIVGRDFGSRFPAKATGPVEVGPVRLSVTNLASAKLDGATLEVRAGEIVGLAGIEGQGQSELLRAIAGLTRASGDVSVDGHPLRRHPTAARRAGVAYVPRDRRAEGVFAGMSVRENVTARALEASALAGVVRPQAERAAARAAQSGLGIKAPTLDADVATLSGGNQQKTVLARALMTDPGILLADEPTQGVDVGARADIYTILRDSADRGSCVLVASADTGELVGLCDRVLVISRGKVIADLTGPDLTERAVRHATLTSTAAAATGSAAAGRRRGAPTRAPGRESRSGRFLGRFLGSDRFPAAVLLVAIAALAAWGTASDATYLSATNLTSILSLFAILAFVALGQQMVLLTGGMDLSVGPLMGFLVVIASFRMSNDLTVLGVLLGLPVLLAGVAGAGLVNFALVRQLRINPMIATLVTYMALQGGSLLLRPQPGGSLSTYLTDQVARKVGPVPIVALLALAVGLGLEVALRRTKWGWRLRAVGSDPEAARRSGVRVARTLAGAYLSCAALTGLAAVLLMGQVGSGDPNAGTNYTFSSIAAVVLAGASVFGGRGSFLAALTGALLVVQISTVSLFVGLSDAWQLYLLGGLTLLAAGFYSQLRRAA